MKHPTGSELRRYAARLHQDDLWREVFADLETVDPDNVQSWTFFQQRAAYQRLRVMLRELYSRGEQLSL